MDGDRVFVFNYFWSERPRTRRDKGGSLQLIVIKCPECNATVKVDAGAEVVTCEYCGTEARVQRRTRFLKRRQPLTPPPPDKARMPVAVEESRNMWWAWVLLALIPLGVAAPCIIGPITCLVQHYDRIAPHWDGGSVLVRDLDGDGVWDIIGHLRRAEDEKQRGLMSAFSGASGEVLWHCELGEWRGGQAGEPIGVLGRTLVRSNGGARLIGVSLADGSITWRRTLGEQIRRICSGPDRKTVVVLTADDQLHAVSAADGRPGGSGKLAGCAPIQGPSPEIDRPDRLLCDSDGSCPELVVDDQIEGTRCNLSIHRPSDRVTIAACHKQPGTNVPMLARYEWPELRDKAPLAEERRRIEASYDDPKRRRRELVDVIERLRKEQGIGPRVLWQVTVPAEDPLGSGGALNARDLGTSDTTVVVGYRHAKQERHRLTAFTLSEGKRLWDIAIGVDSPTQAVVVATPTHAVVSLSDALMAFDIKTGEKAFELRWPDIPRP